MNYLSSGKTQLDYGSFNEIRTIFREAHESTIRGLNKADNLPMPASKNVKEGEPLGLFLMDRKVVKGLRPSVDVDREVDLQVHAADRSGGARRSAAFTSRASAASWRCKRRSASAGPTPRRGARRGAADAPAPVKNAPFSTEVAPKGPFGPGERLVLSIPTSPGVVADAAIYRLS